MPPESAPEWAATYLEAASSFADLVAGLPPSLSGPGLGEWDLRALVGHTSRSLVTVSDYLRRPADSVALESAVDYVASLAAAAGDASVTPRGVEAGEKLGDDPAGAVRALLDRVTADLSHADPDQVITTYAGGMRLRDYVPTRTFELVVHCLDIAAAVPARWTPPAAALREAVLLAAEVAVRRGEGAVLLRLVTGREPGGLAIV
ncbi:MAG TPA: maleylpyruvate isomerase N-terminal domain-containing protein [Nocardioides sp.]|uniref:maleylpyruvate isomerase N-terminal domain-containing protein n=1 Tax=Nocardioides sp. TaxID=35761 RepID=UPI002E311BF8|nr:maleylpyruvate isomerase N-terminal domain-containing protein [Nocardioides sp.]HEX5089965.1 maleylpyruvate isomerase N-terminal domain-containing protein [Nocardioides sp.]